MPDQPAFHLAFPVLDLEATRAFYVNALGCREGRSTDAWLDFDFFGHQLSAHKRPAIGQSVAEGAVDSKSVPIPHFGVILAWDAFDRLAARLRDAAADFIAEPSVRFAGQPGEQATMFVADPSGNCLEFKAFRQPEAVFATK